MCEHVVPEPEDAKVRAGAADGRVDLAELGLRVSLLEPSRRLGPPAVGGGDAAAEVGHSQLPAGLCLGEEVRQTVTRPQFNGRSGAGFRGRRNRRTVVAFTAAWMARSCLSCTSASEPIGPAGGSQFGPMSSVTAPPLVPRRAPTPPIAPSGYRVSRALQWLPRYVSACHCEPFTHAMSGSTRTARSIRPRCSPRLRCGE